MKRCVFLFTLFLILEWPISSYAWEFVNMNKMDTVYADESHCLAAREIRGQDDSSVSCFCRDAIMEARYVYENYLLTQKDTNLNLAFLTLLEHAQQMCGEKFDVYKATQNTEWQWNGPQVMREYPSEKEINEIQPDSKEFRTVAYKVRVIYRDLKGIVIKTEHFPALDRLPPNTKK